MTSTVRFIAFLALGVVWTDSAARTNAPDGTTWRSPVHVQVDRHANVYVDGERVDTLAVLRRQTVCFHKFDPDDPDLAVQFDRRLFHPRHRMRVKLSDLGRPVCRKVDIRANMKVYTGVPMKGFAPDLPPHAVLRVRVVPHPAE